MRQKQKYISAHVQTISSEEYLNCFYTCVFPYFLFSVDICFCLFYYIYFNFNNSLAFSREVSVVT